jgi:adenosyl cobinamide kinase/adenosyl cobinamide phosphate guanylyltransferase
MLSFHKSKTPIAFIEDDEDVNMVFLHDDIDGDKEGMLKTSKENKSQLYDLILKNNKKLSENDIKLMKDAFEKGKTIIEKEKLQRIYSDSLSTLNLALKKRIHIPSKMQCEILPCIAEKSFRMFVSGLSGSGKSVYISKFLRKNAKGKKIFLFSPVEGDEAYSKIKNLQQVFLEDIFEGGDMSLDVFPEGCIIIFDDIESYNKSQLKRHLELRNMVLERGRHMNLSCIGVSHNSMNGNITKQAIRESQYFCLFPKFNVRDTRLLLKNYGGCDSDEIETIMSLKGRGLLYKKSVPRYVVSEHDIIAF